MSTRKSGTKQAKKVRGPRVEANGKPPAVPQPSDVAGQQGNGLPDVASAALEHRSVEWLWPNYVQYGALTLVVGPTGVGKTTLLAAVAAHVAGGPRIGGGKPVAPQNVLWLTIENDVVLEVREKLKAAKCDTARVFHPGYNADGRVAHRLSLPGELHQLRRHIVQRSAALVCIEPMDSFLSDGFDVNSTADVRGLLDTLHQLAQEEHVAIVFTRHFNKCRIGGVLDWVSGSSAWSQCPRTVLTLQEHDAGGGVAVLTNSKPGLVKRPPSWTYRLDDAGSAPRFKLLDQQDPEAQEMPGRLEAAADRSALAEAELFIRAELANGEVKTADLLKRALASGHSERTLRRARERLRVAYVQRGSPGNNDWVYVPPAGGFPPVKP